MLFQGMPPPPRRAAAGWTQVPIALVCALPCAGYRGWSDSKAAGACADVTGAGCAALKEEVWEGGLQICPDFDGCPISWCVRKAVLCAAVPMGDVPHVACAACSKQRGVGCGTGCARAVTSGRCAGRTGARPWDVGWLDSLPELRRWPASFCRCFASVLKTHRHYVLPPCGSRHVNFRFRHFLTCPSCAQGNPEERFRWWCRVGPRHHRVSCLHDHFCSCALTSFPEARRGQARLLRENLGATLDDSCCARTSSWCT
jgi:hypothetical protein